MNNRNEDEKSKILKDQFISLVSNGIFGNTYQNVHIEIHQPAIIISHLSHPILLRSNNKKEKRKFCCNIM